MNKTLLDTRATNSNTKRAPNQDRAQDKPGRRVPPLAVGLGVGAVAFVAFLALTPSLPRSTSVLALRSGVAEGTPITSSQLRVLSMPVASGVATVPASAEQQVLGSRAAASLPAGSLLAPGDYTTSASPQATVGLSLKPGQYPPNLAAGDHVMAVSQPSTGALSSGAMSSFQVPIRAVVLSMRSSTANPDGALVALGVDPSAASTMAVAAAGGQVTLVGVP